MKDLSEIIAKIDAFAIEKLKQSESAYENGDDSLASYARGMSEGLIWAANVLKEKS